MEENLKNAISAMRKDIAELEKQQKNIKPQRKTKNFKGERTVEPREAVEIVRDNRNKLRLYYAAYGLLRGKNFNVTERNARPLDRDYYYETFGWWVRPELIGKHPLCSDLSDINRVLQKYGYEFKNYETKKDYWGGEYRAISLENYEEVVCVGE